jgi:RNA polymerase sigma-70 factor (ECF subfamily)
MNASATPDPEQLLALARAGNAPALGQLLESYRGYLTLLVRVQIGRGLQSKVDPADLIQETFLEAYRDFGRFRGNSEGELVGWFRKILASHLAGLVRHYATKGRNVRLERRFEAELDQSSRVMNLGLVSPSSSPSRQAARREQAVLLANALEQLPDDYREVLILRHLEGLTFPEVGRRMGRSLDSVEKLWTRALPQLRRVLGAAP